MDFLATSDEIYGYTQVDAEYDFEREGRPIGGNALTQLENIVAARLGAEPETPPPSL